MHKKRGIWGVVWGLMLMSELLIGFRLRIDIFIFQSLIGLKLFSELTAKDPTTFAKIILNYSLFIALNGIFFLGKELDKNKVEII